jgi:dipeptidyl aminopeptidase/acylaminoacyl peptidase
VTYLVEQGVADSKRLAIFGHSAGAFRANWFAVSTHRYQAIVSHEGWADELENALKLPPMKGVEEMHGGTPQDVPENYIKNSPVYFASDATTPILFMMGNPQHGGADPFQTVLKLFNLIKNKGIETEYVEYPDEGHSFEKKENKRDALNRVTQWMDKYLLNKPVVDVN